jgi:hypothetical protein
MRNIDDLFSLIIVVTQTSTIGNEIIDSGPQRARQSKNVRYLVYTAIITIAGSFLARFQAQADGHILVKAQNASVRSEDLFLGENPREPPWHFVTVSVLGIKSLVPIAGFSVNSLIFDRDNQLVVSVTGTPRLGPGWKTDGLDWFLFASAIGINEERNARLGFTFVVCQVALVDRDATGGRGQNGQSDCK